jgi:hypothetical protein
MQRRRSILTLAGLLLGLLALAGWSLSPLRGMAAGQVAAGQVAAGQVEEADPLNGEYQGQVVLEGVFTGVYSDTTATPTAVDLGRFGLALNLTQSGQSLSGYVMLEDSLIFSQVHTVTVQARTGFGLRAGAQVQEIATGPSVQGTYDNTTLHLASERFGEVLSGQQVLPFDGRTVPERSVTREFSMVTTAVEEDGARLVGTYRETIWGYAIRPSTVVGTFTLERPRPVQVVTTPVPTDTPVPGPTDTPVPGPTDTPVPPSTPAAQIFLPSVQR